MGNRPHNVVIAFFDGGRFEVGLKITLASIHKCLRPCDLCKELAFGAPDVVGPNRDFTQLVRAQHVVPPVPGER
jgi:hypothetical protein